MNLLFPGIPNVERPEEVIEVVGDNYFGHYRKSRIACRGIVLQGEDILLSYETKTGQWMIPGGGQEKEEDDSDCVAREVQEETGYQVKPSLPVLQIDEYYGNEKFISKYFLCQVTGKASISLTKREQEVGMEPRWIPLRDALLIFGSYRQYEGENEMRRGLYLREFLALKRIFPEQEDHESSGNEKR